MSGSGLSLRCCIVLYLVVVVVHVDAHTCGGVCDAEACSPAPAECAAGRVLDECGCCRVCAKSEGEVCGGAHGLKGKCGEGLTCIVRVESGKSPTGQEEGICRVLETSSPCTKKSYSGCNIIGDRECACEEHESCSVVHFQFASLDECQTALAGGGDKCKNVVCPEDNVTCPDDSYKLPGIKHLDECCSVSEGCDCLPETTCKKPVCNKLEVLKKVTHLRKPGSCCPVYQCVYETCVDDNGIVHKHLEKWENKCNSYLCRNGVLEQDEKKPCHAAHLATCSFVEIPRDSCCPVCTGCISSGKMYKNNESWIEEYDHCITCTCENGQKHCQSEMCHATCRNPVQIPGVCCGVCPEPDYITISPDCSHVVNCPTFCHNGFQKDVNGCFICECRPDNCDLECPLGYIKDSSGVPLCACTSTEDGKCPPLNCRRKCPDGYRVDKNNCTTCKCNHCKKLKDCSVDCPNGFETDVTGCKICKCLEGSVAAHAKCRSSDGRLYDHGQSWNDGCRNCICMEGRELCSLIFCPNPSCKHPTIYKGECCAKCLGDEFSVVRSNLTVCHAGHDHKYVQGEMWNIDRCTSCICHEGRFLCDAQECPPTPCERPVVRNGCCPECPDIHAPPSDKGKLPCYAADGLTKFEHGKMWRPSACQSCVCESSKIKCFSETCPKLLCSRPLLQKNKCCPVCPDKLNSTSYCVFNDSFYANGERWIVDKCTSCECHHGAIKCVQNRCSKMCTDAEYHLHSCCVGCIDKRSSDYNHGLIFICLGVLIATGLAICVCVIFCICCKKRLHSKSPNILILHAKEANLDDSKSVQCKLITRLPDITYSGNS